MKTKADRNIACICPDDVRRTFYQNGKTTGGNLRGFVQVWDKAGRKQVSVAGYAKAAGRGFKFFPHFDGENIGLVRPAPLPLKTRVRMKDGRTGAIVAFVGWNYVTPTYRVRMDAVEVEGDKDFTVISNS